VTTLPQPRPTRSPRRPGADRDDRMLAEYATTRRGDLRDQLVRRYLPLARFSAARYAKGSEPFDDLLQVACIGLLKALERYDPVRGVAFTSYALPTMHGELRRHFRDRGWDVRPPRDLQEHALDVERATGDLIRDLGRTPTVDEIGARAGLSAEAVLEAREALSARNAVSFSAPAGGEGDSVLGDQLGRDDRGFEVAEQRATIAELERHLTVREREIMHLRFDQDLTQAEIGELVGLSQMHVSRLLRSVLEKLRHEAARSVA
jgi:RNA polymerase sigma-B factor